MLRDLVEHFSTLELTIAALPEDELGNGYEYRLRTSAPGMAISVFRCMSRRRVSRRRSMRVIGQMAQTVLNRP